MHFESPRSTAVFRRAYNGLNEEGQQISRPRQQRVHWSSVSAAHGSPITPPEPPRHQHREQARRQQEQKQEQEQADADEVRRLQEQQQVCMFSFATRHQYGNCQHLTVAKKELSYADKGKFKIIEAE